MNDFTHAIVSAFALIARLDPELAGIVALSLRVSLTASLIALVIGAPFGAYLAVSRFHGRQTVIVLTNAFLGLPPVVAGLGLYLLLSRAGPLGSAGLLFTPTAMISRRRCWRRRSWWRWCTGRPRCCGPNMATSRASTGCRTCEPSA